MGTPPPPFCRAPPLFCNVARRADKRSPQIQVPIHHVFRREYLWGIRVDLILPEKPRTCFSAE